ncbi:hypothetical protein PRSY57_0322400 [Plasmodium reichenowi]|uniref:Rab-GAP TBC domain-containing protein n=1 Tax=Plasmodium reichenowi TaxID=5854 RepID=A0A151LU70_PLARE|nr:hypothetical protein PRSY57_0322400 [Plasmodium reichenowi]KYO02724.1 hypothetical protein PRSY57_0322400 [Plasmodium reichenowi]
MKDPLKKKEREKGYYSCLDFDNLYKKKKKKKLKYSINRDKNLSDTELYEKTKLVIRKKNNHTYISKHNILRKRKEDEKLCLLNNVTIYKDYFDKGEDKNDEKLRNLKKILRIYENVSTNEKKKLYELIKFFSFSEGGFQNNKLRQKVWLLLLGFNINISKEKNYNEHPISILCRNQKKKFKYDDNSITYFKLKWKKKKDNQYKHDNNYNYFHVGQNEKMKERERINKKKKIGKKNNRKKYVLRKNNTDGNNNYNDDNNDHFDNDHNDIVVDDASYIDNSNYSCSSNSSLISVSSHSSYNAHSALSFESISHNSLNSSDYSLYPSTSSVLSSSSNSPLSSSVCSYVSNFSDNLKSVNDQIGLIKSKGDDEKSGRGERRINKKRKRGRKRCPLHFFSARNSYELGACEHTNCSDNYNSKREKSLFSNVLFFYKKSKRNIRRRSKCLYDGNKKAKKCIKKETKRIVDSILSIDKDKENFDKKKNRKFLIKLLKIIYKNLLEIDLYIVDYIIRKDKLKEEKSNILTYLQYNIKNNYNMNSDIRRWIIDSVLLDENDRIQVKKDVKRSVNTWNVHKSIIYEIKKTYQYILKNIICSILYKHSNKIYYAQGVHDVCLVFITLYFHKFFLRYKKYVFLEHFISRYVVNKICHCIYSKRRKRAIGKKGVPFIFDNSSSDVLSEDLYIKKFSLFKKKGVDYDISSVVNNVNDKICTHINDDDVNNIMLQGGSRNVQNVERLYDNNNNNNKNNNNSNSNSSSSSNNNYNNVSEVIQTNFINFENFEEFENYFKKGDSNIVDMHSNDNIHNSCSLIKKKGNICMYDIFEDNINNMFLMEEEYIEKICLLKNINLNKYIKYKKKKKKKEYIVYLLCERFLLFYMIDYLTLSLDISIKNTFKSIGLLLKYLDIDVYNVFCLLQKEQEGENMKYNNRNYKKNDNEKNARNSSLKLSGTEFFFCLSWVVTYYSHVLTEFDKLARIFDTLLSNNGIFIIYFTSAIILYKKEELLNIANKKKKDQGYNNLYSETHYIFQNMNWKDINVENIIKKTYYYMNYKIPFDTFLNKIKNKISFPPFSPIYSYPFILHHFDYEAKQEELKNMTVEKSILNFYNYKNGEYNNIQNYELKDTFVKDTSVKDTSVKDTSMKDTLFGVMGNVTSLNNNNKKEIKIKEAYKKNSLNSDNNIRNNVSNDCVNNSDCNSAYYNILREEKYNKKKKNHNNNDDDDNNNNNNNRDIESVSSFNGFEVDNSKHRSDLENNNINININSNNINFNNSYNMKIELSKMKTYDKYIDHILNDEKGKDKERNDLYFNNNCYKDNNIYLYYPYSILCNNLDLNNNILRKHLLVEHFFKYVLYDFILNYEGICKKYQMASEKIWYTVKYVHVRSKKEVIIYKRRKEKERKKCEKIFHKMTRHIMLLYLHKCNKKKNKKYIYMNFLRKHKTSLSFNHFTSNKMKMKTNNKIKRNHSYKNNHKNNNSNISNKARAIIPPIYKYIIQNSSNVIKNDVSCKKTKINNPSSHIKENNKKKIFEHIFYLLKMSMHNSPYVHFFLIFFLITLFTSLFYYRR